LIDYAANGSLSSLIKSEGKLSENNTATIAAQIVVALEFLHTKDFAHRDLKPDNILIDYDANIQVCDFGEAK
jgi:serine/threonine protein kinase